MIVKYFFQCFLLLLPFCTTAKTTIVKNKEELSKANKEAKPGDTIRLKNGTWNDISITLDCIGAKENPITFSAESAGGVLITGYSKLNIGGSFITVDGLYFTKGFSGNDAVITFRSNKNNVANNCRITNTVINDFNNLKRLDENYWIALYGKHNRIDHCTFLNKKNIGVLLAVILEEERSRENFHSIDHNHFGVRLPLASNAGEIIRVGVSQHCEFSSNTQIIDNFFEHCDGETEIVSIKSCNNVIRNNLFKECQGGVVLRHGNFNTVENNLFFGSNKSGTGGIRIINKGQWVVNNFFYKCRGEGFRSPMSIMNGVPNSPANRYVPVTDAVIANNSFFECSPISFCEGNDTERSVAPNNVIFANNLFYNNIDSVVYNTYDNISGIKFTNNPVSKTVKQSLVAGFTKSNFSLKKLGIISFPISNPVTKNSISDSIKNAGMSRLSSTFSNQTGYAGIEKLLQIQTKALKETGAKWFAKKNVLPSQKQVTVNCKTAEEIIDQLEKNKDVKLRINLTGSNYNFSNPIIIKNDVIFVSNQKNAIKVSANFPNFLFHLTAGKYLSFSKISLDLTGIKTKAFITTDTTVSSNHSNFSMIRCFITGLEGTFFNAAKSSISDSIVVRSCRFIGGKGTLFNLSEEVDKKGYYNVEHFKMIGNTIEHRDGQFLSILRSGNDESTMGPSVLIENNTLIDMQDTSKPLIMLVGVQQSLIAKNNFTKCNESSTLVEYKDVVRADHHFRNNISKKSGIVKVDKYVSLK